jgi:fumarate reductase flavoprotein subunit
MHSEASSGSIRCLAITTRDLLELSGPYDGDHLVHVLAQSSAGLLEWLHDAAGIRLDIITDYKHVGHSVPRLHAPASRKGEDLTHDLLIAVDTRGIPLALSSPAVTLLRGGSATAREVGFFTRWL